MRTVWPTGSALAPKSLSTTVCPSTTTLAPRVDVGSAEATRPRATGQLRIAKYSGVVPVTAVVQFWSSLIDLARCERSCGAAYLHRRHLAPDGAQVVPGERRHASRSRRARRPSCVEPGQRR